MRLIEFLERLDEIKGYHGSRSEEYPVFYLGHTGYNSHTFGEYQSTRYGAFFTDNPEVAKQYGDVRAYEFDPQNVLNLDKVGDTIVWHFVQKMKDIDYGVYQDARNAMYADHPYWHFFEDEIGQYFVKYLREQGYDAATFREEIGDEMSNTIVVLDMSKIIGNQLSFEFD
jgi:hypothetical protein